MREPSTWPAALHSIFAAGATVSSVHGAQGGGVARREHSARARAKRKNTAKPGAPAARTRAARAHAAALPLALARLGCREPLAAVGPSLRAPGVSRSLPGADLDQAAADRAVEVAH